MWDSGKVVKGGVDIFSLSFTIDLMFTHPHPSHFNSNSQRDRVTETFILAFVKWLYQLVSTCSVGLTG